MEPTDEPDQKVNEALKFCSANVNFFAPFFYKKKKKKKDEGSLVAFKAIYQKYKINHPTSPRREEFSFAAVSVTIFDHISHMYLLTFFVRH